MALHLEPLRQLSFISMKAHYLLEPWGSHHLDPFTLKENELKTRKDTRQTALLSSGFGEARMALCFLFTSSTFSARDSIKPRISSTCRQREKPRSVLDVLSCEAGSSSDYFDRCWQRLSWGGNYHIRANRRKKLVYVNMQTEEWVLGFMRLQTIFLCDFAKMELSHVFMQASDVLTQFEHNLVNHPNPANINVIFFVCILHRQ